MKKSREEKPTTEFPLSGKICKRKFKVKNINKKFHRVLNIAFAFGVNKKTFKCITSWCHFKTNDVDRFYSHLKEHHSEDVTIKTHSFCMICDGKIAADDYNGEFLHMIAHIEGAEQSQKLILILQAESKSDLEQNGFEDDNKKFTQKLEDKLLKELEDKSATKVANYEADSIDAELAEMFNDKKENNSKIIILGGASNDDIETVEENDIHDSAIGDDDDEPQFSVIEENLSTVPVISKSKVSDEKTKISTENFTKKLVNQTVNIPRKFRPSLSLARSLNQSPFIITGSEKKSPNKEFVKQLIRDEKLSLYHQTPQAAPAILDPIMGSPNQNDPSHSNPASTLQLTPNVRVALSGNFSKETCDINKLLTCPFHITQVTPNEPIKVLTSAEIYPWLSANHSHKVKYEICHKNMLQKNSLIALFKCMNIRCSFTTNDVELFFNHLKFHNRNQSSDKSSCLLCTYCMFKTSDEKALVHHINDVHSRDIFQCSRCFYRARDKESCYQHTLLRHKCLNTLIYKCPGPDKVDSKRDAVVMDRLKRKRQMFVAPIRCKLCDLKFFLLDPFMKHMENHGKSCDPVERNSANDTIKTLEEPFETKSYGLFQCLYCVSGASTDQEMSEHLAESHPSEHHFCCMRASPPSLQKSTSPYSIESTLIYKINLRAQINVEEFVGDLSDLTSSNFKTTMDRNLFQNKYTKLLYTHKE